MGSSHSIAGTVPPKQTSDAIIPRTGTYYFTIPSSFTLTRNLSGKLQRLQQCRLHFAWLHKMNGFTQALFEAPRATSPAAPTFAAAAVVLLDLTGFSGLAYSYAELRGTMTMTFADRSVTTQGYSEACTTRPGLSHVSPLLQPRVGDLQGVGRRLPGAVLLGQPDDHGPVRRGAHQGERSRR